MASKTVARGDDGIAQSDARGKAWAGGGGYVGNQRQRGDSPVASYVSESALK